VISINLTEPSQAYKALAEVWQQVKPLLIAGRKQTLIIQDFEDSLTAQQRKYYHGYILNEVAKQASIEGRKYNLQIWKEHFRDKYLGEVIETIVNPMTGAERKEVVRVSSESLGVKGYSELIEKVTAFAVTELNVNFDLSFDQWKDSQ